MHGRRSIAAYFFGIFGRGAALLLAAGLAVASARAHDAGLSLVEVRALEDTFELSVSYALSDVQRMLPPSVRLGTDSSKPTIDAARGRLEELASLLWDVRADGQPLIGGDLAIEFNASDNLVFRFNYPRPATGVVVFRSANLGGLPASHREVFTLVDEKGRPRVTRTLSSGSPSISVPMDRIALEPAAVAGPEPSPAAGSAPGLAALERVQAQNRARETLAAGTPPVAVGSSLLEFFKLGVWHIWMGFDHLLFLFALLVACRNPRTIAIIVTSFTVAHSITLGLATLDIVSLPARLVEPLIAASIVLVGIQNLLLRGKEPRGRGWLTFGFGLIHGFGFAGVLRGLGVGAQGGGIAVPLLSFNLGVEFGQLCVVAILLPLMTYVLRTPQSRPRGMTLASSLVVAVGLYWLVERSTTHI